jgi:hypothetical protein
MMRGLLKLTLCATVFISTLAAQNPPTTFVVHGNCENGLPTYRQWFEETQLPSGKAYVVGEQRKQQILQNYTKVKLQMTVEQVEELLGQPDFSAAHPRGHLSTAPEAAKPICSNQIAYVFQKKSENMTDMDDVAIYLFFSPENELTWLAPQNISELRAMGGPTQ